MNNRLQFIEDEHGDTVPAVIHTDLSPQAAKLVQYALPHIVDCIDEICEWFEIEHGDLEALATVCQDGRNWFSEDPVLAERLSKDADPFSMCLECSLFCLSAFLDTLEPPAQMAEAAVNLAKSVEYLSAFKAATVFAGNMPPEEATACMEEVAAGINPKRTRKDGLTIAMEQGWGEYLDKHGTEPTARALFDLLAKSASDAGPVIAHDEVGEKLTWRRQDGGLAETTFKAFQNRFTTFKTRM